MAPTPKPPSHSSQDLHGRGIDVVAKWWKKLIYSRPVGYPCELELELSTLGQPAAKSGSAPQLPELDLGPVFDSGAFHGIQKRDGSRPDEDLALLLMRGVLVVFFVVALILMCKHIFGWAKRR